MANWADESSKPPPSSLLQERSNFLSSHKYLKAASTKKVKSPILTNYKGEGRYVEGDRENTPGWEKPRQRNNFRLPTIWSSLDLTVASNTHHPWSATRANGSGQTLQLMVLLLLHWSIGISENSRLRQTASEKDITGSVSWREKHNFISWSPSLWILYIGE